MDGGRLPANREGGGDNAKGTSKWKGCNASLEELLQGVEVSERCERGNDMQQGVAIVPPWS